METIDWDKPLVCLCGMYKVKYTKAFVSMADRDKGATLHRGKYKLHAKRKDWYVVLWNDKGVPIDLVSGKEIAGHPLTVRNETDMAKTKFVEIDWDKPIVCLDGTTAQYVEKIAKGTVYRGRYNSTGELYHEIHWDKFGRVYGSDNNPLDNFGLNVKNI